MWRDEDEWDQCFKVSGLKDVIVESSTVSHVILVQKTFDIQLPEQIYLGFTAHTGEVTGIDGTASVFSWII